jgi:hypothetical protein
MSHVTEQCSFLYSVDQLNYFTLLFVSLLLHSHGFQNICNFPLLPDPAREDKARVGVGGCRWCDASVMPSLVGVGDAMHQ